MPDQTQGRLVTAADQLTHARADPSQKITAYPKPISGCNAQFNHLLAQRTRIDAALSALSRDVHIPTLRTPH